MSTYRSCCVSSGHTYDIYSACGPSTYVYCAVSYGEIAALSVRIVAFIFALLLITRNISGI